MGMGEPLLNLPSVTAAVRYLQTHIGISGRAITVSTVGVPNAIAKLAAQRLTCTLAVSIHAPNQQLRERIIPSAKVYPLEALMQDCRGYFDATGRRVTFEYTLMSGVNDGLQEVRERDRG
jgi:23S rRNA (adenine2503-C2)-methyltransferase